MLDVRCGGRILIVLWHSAHVPIYSVAFAHAKVTTIMVIGDG